MTLALSTVTGSTFSFTATPAGLLNYQWSFGDGNTASGMTATVTYSTQGSFTVTVTEDDSCGNQFTYSDDVATCDVPAGDFTFNIVSTSANGMVVNFAANATGADEYHWYWGDGTNDKVLRQISHTYGVITTNYIINLFWSEMAIAPLVTHRLNEVGIGEQALPIALYPNPLSTFLHVDLPAGAETLLDIYNAQGQLVRFQVPIDATNHRGHDAFSAVCVVRVLWENGHITLASQDLASTSLLILWGTTITDVKNRIKNPRCEQGRNALKLWEVPAKWALNCRSLFWDGPQAPRPIRGRGSFHWSSAFCRKLPQGRPNN